MQELKIGDVVIVESDWHLVNGLAGIVSYAALQLGLLVSGE
jgi:hypothetical protein